MAKINLAELLQLNNEVGSLLGKEISFPLKFRIETKLITELEKGRKMISQKLQEIALKNGAVESETKGWEFKKGEDGKINDVEKFEVYVKESNIFLTENEVEIDIDFRLSLFESLNCGEHFPVLCKFIVE